MAFQEAVSRLTVETVYRTQGADTAANEARQVDGAQAKLIETANKLTTATGRQEQALIAYARAAQTASQQSQQLASANDNMARGWQAANDNLQSASKSIIDVGSAVLSTAGHLKLLGVAAYAISPTFRSIANTGLAASVAAIGPAAASAAGVILSALAPALAFLARISIPITIIVAAFQLLNSVISQGADLVKKYGDAQRNLVSGVDDNLAKLTKFQDSNLSAEQVEMATRLGARLNDAKRTLSDFARVQFDVTDLALKLQNAWVVVVEIIAAAVTKLNDFINLIGRIPSGLSSLLGFGGSDTSTGGATSQSATAAAMAAARQRLAAGMGSQSTFANRFGQAINDLANPPKADNENKARETVLEFDRLEKSLQRQAAAQEAEARAVGASVGEHARLRTEMRLQEAALQDIAKHGGDLDDYADRIKKISDRFARAAQNAAELKLQSDINFDRSQIGRTSDEQQIASKLRAVYGDGYQQEMNGAIAQQMRFNQELQFTHDIGQNAFRDLITGAKSFGEVATDALNKVANKLADMAFNNLWSAAFPGGGGGFLGFLGFGSDTRPGATLGGSNFIGPLQPSATGNVFSGGNLIPFAHGGVVSGPTIFPMANGAGLMGEAGPEAIMPLRRGSDGRLGVSAPGGGSAGGAISIHVISTVDKDGNISTLVKEISGQIAGQAVRAAAPAIVNQSKAAVAAQNKNSRGFIRGAV